MANIEIRCAAWQATVTLNRPEVRNAFNDEVIYELTKAFHELGGRDETSETGPDDDGVALRCAHGGSDQLKGAPETRSIACCTMTAATMMPTTKPATMRPIVAHMTERPVPVRRWATTARPIV